VTRNAPFWFLPLGLLLAVQGLCEEPFPRPAELEPDVAFWVRVFSAVDSDSGLLHDNRNLAIVYREIVVPADLPARTRQKQVDAEKEQVRTVLETLASGKREGLSAEESAILELWGTDASDATFREAATRIRFQRGLADRFRAGLKRAGRALARGRIGHLAVHPQHRAPVPAHRPRARRAQ
jgi:membrane-bound lytic murein transglycosylase D